MGGGRNQWVLVYLVSSRGKTIHLLDPRHLMQHANRVNWFVIIVSVGLVGQNGAL